MFYEGMHVNDVSYHEYLLYVLCECKHINVNLVPEILLKL